MKKNKIHNPTQHPTSWEPIGKWYQDLVGEEGHYYHRQIIIPSLLKQLEGSDSLLDLACGTGILAHYIPKQWEYFGVDIAAGFIKSAKEAYQSPLRKFLAADIVQPLNLPKKDFSSAACILAAQNLEKPLEAFKNARIHLKAKGKFIVVLNHPCFRIPRQSSWGIDDQKKLQYRRIDRYMSPMAIPIQAHPGKGQKSETTLTYHHPLGDYCRWFFEAGFNIETIEEWCSDKISTGKNAKMENRSREEFPLFLCIRAIKI